MADQRDGTVGKAVEVLDLIAGQGRPARLSELLESSPLPKATLYRTLRTLVHQGMLSYDPDSQTYRLGMRLVQLAHAAWRQSSLAPIARPHLEQLAQATGETVHLAQLDNGQVLYVDKRNARRPIEMFSDAGKVGPAYCTGVGKAMLAFLPEDTLPRALAQQSFHRFTPKTHPDEGSLRADLAAIRTRGYAFDDEEHEPGIICVAAPVLSARGRVLGAVSITGSTQRTSLNALGQFAPRLNDTVCRIAEEAELWRFPEATKITEPQGVC